MSLPRFHADPAPIFEHFRGVYGTELLTAAVAHFDLFGRLAKRGGLMTELDLRGDLGLGRRPMAVLLTALRAMKLLERTGAGEIRLTALSSEHLLPGGLLNIGDYIGLAAGSPGVLEMVARLKSDQPAGADHDGQGTAFIYRQGVPSAMEKTELARHFTLALTGRAKNVAPVLADRLSLEGARVLLDVAGGSGIYSVALLQHFPHLRAIVWDRPEVLTVAAEFAQQYGVASRLECRPGDMFVDPVPQADAVLLSNVLHDWDEEECLELVRRCAAVLPLGGQMIIHDVFLDDDLGGPLPHALYSAALFTLTEGRLYSANEMQAWLAAAGLQMAALVPTAVHASALCAMKLAE